MKAVSVTTSETELAPAGHRDFLHIQNNSAGDVFVKYDGDSDAVTTALGVKLAAGEWLVLNNDGTRKIFTHRVTAIVASGSADVRVMGAE